MQTFDDFEIPLLTLITQYKPYFDKTQKASLKYKFDLNDDIFKNHVVNAVDKTGKKHTFKFIPIGMIKENTFTWYSDLYKLFYTHMMKYNIDSFNHNFFAKLFQKQVEFKANYRMAIPYFLSIISPSFNIIEAYNGESNTSFIFAVNLGLKDNFKFEKFLAGVDAVVMAKMGYDMQKSKTTQRINKVRRSKK